MFNKELCIRKIAQIAMKALLYEVSVTPKPGLVDKNNSGSHNNMDFFTFMASASTLAPYFERFTTLGYEYGSSRWSLEELFIQSRTVGVQAEKDMFAATNNVNTHKGLIFSLGLICCACGYILATDRLLDTEHICYIVECLTKNIIDIDLGSLPRNRKPTNGERLFLKYGVTGIRGEAQSGFKTVRTISLPVLKSMIEVGADINRASLQTLVALMASTQDTNVIARHGFEMLDYVHKTAADYLSMGGVLADDAMKGLLSMDSDFIAKNISPGGCADLLCITLMLYFINQTIF